MLALLLSTHRAAKLNTTGFLTAFVVGTLTALAGRLAGDGGSAVLWFGLVGKYSGLLKPLNSGAITFGIDVAVGLVRAHIRSPCVRPFLGSVAAVSSISATRFAIGSLKKRAFAPIAAIIAISLVILPSVLLDEWPALHRSLSLCDARRFISTSRVFQHQYPDAI